MWVGALTDRVPAPTDTIWTPDQLFFPGRQSFGGTTVPSCPGRGRCPPPPRPLPPLPPCVWGCRLGLPSTRTGEGGVRGRHAERGLQVAQDRDQEVGVAEIVVGVQVAGVRFGTESLACGCGQRGSGQRGATPEFWSGVRGSGSERLSRDRPAYTLASGDPQIPQQQHATPCRRHPPNCGPNPVAWTPNRVYTRYLMAPRLGLGGKSAQRAHGVRYSGG